MKDEAGGNEIAVLFDDKETHIGISVLSFVEIHGVLRAIGREADLANIVEQYRPLFAEVVPVDEDTALRAMKLRQGTSSRLPGIDAIIAATAAQHNAILVHRDAHFLAITDEGVRQQFLGEEDEQAP